MQLFYKSIPVGNVRRPAVVVEVVLHALFAAGNRQKFSVQFDAPLRRKSFFCKRFIESDSVPVPFGVGKNSVAIENNGFHYYILFIRRRRINLVLFIACSRLSGLSSTAEQVNILDNTRLEFIELGIDDFQRIILGIIRVVVIYETVDECVFELG